MKQSTCHPEKVNYCKGLCRNCYEKELREKNPNYYERQKESSRNWNKNNKEHKATYDRNRRNSDPNKTENNFIKHLKSKYKLNIDDYNILLKDQNHKCKLCNRDPSQGKKLHVDHNHETGQVRGLLCAQCNWYLGFIEKDPNIITRIKEYLQYE